MLRSLSLVSSMYQLCSLCLHEFCVSVVFLVFAEFSVFILFCVFGEFSMSAMCSFHLQSSVCLL